MGKKQNKKKLTRESDIEELRELLELDPKATGVAIKQVYECLYAAEIKTVGALLDIKVGHLLSYRAMEKQATFNLLARVIRKLLLIVP